jgi:hypothetical protein
MSYLFVAIEPLPHETRLLVSVPYKGTALKARLPEIPEDDRALAMLLEALVAWYGLPLCAVLDADAEDVQRHPDRWGRILGDRFQRCGWSAKLSCRPGWGRRTFRGSLRSR